MSNEAIIIRLIQMDMKHNQLVGGLRAIGLDGGGLFEIGALEMISELMQFPEGKIEDRLYAMYVGFIDEAANYEITDRGESLRQLAELAYRQLRAFVDYKTEHAQSSESDSKTLC